MKKKNIEVSPEVLKTMQKYMDELCQKHCFGAPPPPTHVHERIEDIGSGKPMIPNPALKK